MKFVSLDSAQTSGPANIAVHTDTKIDGDVFSRLQYLATSQAVHVWLSLTPSGLMKIESSARPQVAITGETLQHLEVLYLEARESVDAENRARQDKHAEFVQLAADVTGLPIDSPAVATA